MSTLRSGRSRVFDTGKTFFALSDGVATGRAPLAIAQRKLKCCGRCRRAQVASVAAALVVAAEAAAAAAAVALAPP